MNSATSPVRISTSFDPNAAGRLQRQRQHLGIGRGAVLPSEGFDAGLQEFARPAAAIAEHRPEIAEARRLAGARGGEIVPRHREW